MEHKYRPHHVNVVGIVTETRESEILVAHVDGKHWFPKSFIGFAMENGRVSLSVPGWFLRDKSVVVSKK